MTAPREIRMLASRRAAQKPRRVSENVDIQADEPTVTEMSPDEVRAKEDLRTSATAVKQSRQLEDYENKKKGKFMRILELIGE